MGADAWDERDKVAEEVHTLPSRRDAVRCFM